MHWPLARVRAQAAPAARRSPPPAATSDRDTDRHDGESAPRLQDTVHPTGLAALFWAPVLLAVLPVVALVAGGMSLATRAVAWWMDAVIDAGRLLRGLARAGWSRFRALIAPVFDFAPAKSGPPRPSERRFHGDDTHHHNRPKAMEPVTPDAMAQIRRVLAETPDKGESELPQDLATLARLLSDPPPSDDFAAADMVRDCFADFGTSGIRSRALLAVALHLSRQFALSTRLPLATLRAWHMLDTTTFEDEMAAQLGVIGRFIKDWQKSQATFLVLDHAEIELIEFLFEAMHPAHHAKEMADVLDFKVLSNRRQGLLRRIPHRLRKTMLDLGRGPEGVEYLTAMQTFLDTLSHARTYQPIVDAAVVALEEVGKLAAKLLPPPPAQGGQGGGHELARIQPVKMPASELAERAMREAGAPSMPSQPAAPSAPVPAVAAAPPPQSPPAIPSPPPPRPQAAIRPAKPSRRPMVSGPAFSASGTGFTPKPGIGINNPRARPPAVTATTEPLLGKRATLPAFAFEPLPELVGSALLPALPAPARPAVTTATPAAKASVPFSGRISLPTPRPAASSASGGAPGRVEPPTRPAGDGGATVTALTVVSKKKRAPITQAIKRQSVLKVLRGESAASVAATLGIRETKLDEWVDAFVAAGAGALSMAKGKPSRKAAASEPLSAELLRAKLAEVLATAQMIERAMETQLPPRRPMLLASPGPGDDHHVPRRPRKKG